MSESPSNAAEPDACYDERALVTAARCGDTRAFESLYLRLASSVYGFCLRLARDSTEAQDCVQETFVRAWQRLDDFRGESRLGTWLHRIALNEVLRRRRHRAVEHRHLATIDPSTRRSLDDSATMRDLEEAIARLPERSRDVFVLSAIYGYTHEEIGAMLGVNEGTSKSQLHRARKLLIAALPGRYGEDLGDEHPLADAANETSE
jgi:RNA polymerase sigma-70 factor (ECF subfamily)